MSTVKMQTEVAKRIGQENREETMQDYTKNDRPQEIGWYINPPTIQGGAPVR